MKPRKPDVRLTIQLPDAVVQALDGMAAEAKMKRIHLIRSLINAIIEDDAAAHGKAVPVT